jgi:hypothetical protein
MILTHILQGLECLNLLSLEQLREAIFSCPASLDSQFTACMYSVRV